MFLLMLMKDWGEMDLQTDDGRRARVKGYMMPIEGGGRIQAVSFMPVFATFEHAEAARGDSPAPIYEVQMIPPSGSSPDEFRPKESDQFYEDDGDEPQWT